MRPHLGCDPFQDPKFCFRHSFFPPAQTCFSGVGVSATKLPDVCSWELTVSDPLLFCKVVLALARLDRPTSSCQSAPICEEAVGTNVPMVPVNRALLGSSRSGGAALFGSIAQIEQDGLNHFNVQRVIRRLVEPYEHRTTFRLASRCVLSPSDVGLSSRGEIWHDLKAWIVENVRETGILKMPTVNEPFLCWTFSGEVEFQEREIGGPWVVNRIIERGRFTLRREVRHMNADGRF